MNKKFFISLASVTLLSLGFVANESNLNTEVVHATTMNQVKKGKRVKLTHNAYVYNNKGKRVKVSTLKRGNIYKILSIKTIHGKKYARIGQNKYVKISNFTSKKISSSTATAKLSHNAYIYNAQGKRTSKKTLKKGKIVYFLGTVIINGKKYAQIGENQFVRNSNVSTHITVVQYDDQGNKNIKNTTKKAVTNSNGSLNIYDGNTNIDQSNFSNLPVTGPTAEPAPKKNETKADEDKYQEDLDKELELKHNNFYYDNQGNRILGTLANKGQKVWVNGLKKINGGYYYQLGSEDEGYNYIPASAFDDNGKDVKLTPASDDEFISFRNDIYRIRNQYRDQYRYSLSSKNKKDAFDKAMNQAERVASFKYSSLKDMEIAKNALKDVGNKLDGTPVEVEQNYDGSYTLNEAQKKQIIILANRYLNTNDARFTSDGKGIIYSKGNSFLTSDIYPFIKFVHSNKPINPKPSESIKPEDNIGKQLQLKHSSYQYDDNGEHYLPVCYQNRGDNIWISGVKEIKGTKYYKLGDDRYIKISSFENNGKDDPISKRPSKDTLNLLKKTWAKYENMNVRISSKYQLATPSTKMSFDTAMNNASSMTVNKYASNSDIKRTVDMLNNAYKALDGKKIKLPQGIMAKDLTQDQKNKILKFAENITNSNDAFFSDNNEKIYFTNKYGMEYVYTRDYVDNGSYFN